MIMFEHIRKFFSKSVVEEVPVKNPPKGDVATPKYLGKARGDTIADTTMNISNLDLGVAARYSTNMSETIKKLVLSSPDLSLAVETKIKSAVSSRFSAIVYDDVGRIDVVGTEIIQSFILRMNYGTHDYSKFTLSRDIRSLATSFLFDSFRYGSGMLEVVLGKTRLPAYVKPISTRLITWADNTPDVYPIYKGPEDDIPLNFPTIFYSASMQDGETAYSDSPLQSAIQAALWDNELMNELRRAATKNLFQRLVVTINSEKFMETVPLDVRNDRKKLKEYRDELINDLEGRMQGLSPEDALVIWDSLDVGTISDANRSEDRSIKVLQELVNGKVAAGAKILPSIIGRGDGADAASTESLLFLKNIAAAQLEFNLMFSKLLTFVLRLYNQRGFAVFALEEVNLRPYLELASFRAIEQSSYYEQLSLGQISDVECSLKVTGTLPPDGYKNLSGTMFRSKGADTSGNNYSNTSVSADGKPDSTQSQKNTDA